MRYFLLGILFLTPSLVSAGVVVPRLPASIFKPKPSPEPDAEKSEIEEIVEQISESAKFSSGLLAQENLGPDTQRTQENILRNIDKLLNQTPPQSSSSSSSISSEPPPESGEAQPPPMGSSSDDSQQSEAQPQQGKGQPKPDPGEEQRRPTQPAQPNNAEPKPAQATPGQPGQTGKPAQPLMLAVPEDAVTKAVWGHLPEQLRQQMDQFYREEFMPEYSTLLQQYYAELAKQKEPRR